MPDAERPSKIIFVVVTDGEENASREFDRARVTTLITAKKSLGWDFVFLSADISAFEDADRMGVASASRIKFAKSKRGSDAVWASVGEKVSARRSGVAASVAFDALDLARQEEAEQELRDR